MMFFKRIGKRLLAWIVRGAFTVITRSRLWQNQRGMMFDVMRIIFMAISIVAGNFAGTYLAGIIGTWGALLGALIVGMVIYYFYSLLSGQKTFILGAVAFGILNYISTIVTGLLGGTLGLAGGIFSIVIQAVVLSVLWGYLGGKAQPSGTVKTGLKL